MTLDVQMRSVAARLINGFGKSLTLKQNVYGGYDPATSQQIVTTTATPIVGVLESPGRFDLASGVAQAGDRYVAVAASDLVVEPKPGDLLTMDGVDWQIVSTTSTFSGELAAVYSLHVRK